MGKSYYTKIIKKFCCSYQMIRNLNRIYLGEFGCQFRKRFCGALLLIGKIKMTKKAHCVKKKQDFLRNESKKCIKVG